MIAAVLVSDFDYELPPDRIAKHSVEPRDAARLFVLDRSTGATTHATVADLPQFLAPGDLLVSNDTRVMPWRLRGSRGSGGAVECLLVRVEGTSGEALLKPSKKLREGDLLRMEHGALSLRLERALGGGRWQLTLLAPDGNVDAVLERCGRAPLPPYVERDDEEDVAKDRERYQTVFARVPGAIAAPTAGLHFTPRLLQQLAERGVELASVTLHVGEGTFASLRTDVVEQHRMHSEVFELPPTTAAAIAAAKARGNRVVAIGTTSCRTLETCARDDGTVQPGRGASDLFLYPGARFRCIDALFTNFRLPKSTLVMLVAAFAGRERILAAYHEAVERGYRFFSFGDAMLIL